MSLTDEDIARFMKALDAAESKRMESIGYDLSTPAARAEIHADHVFVRDLRNGTSKAKVTALGAFIVAMLAVVGHWVMSGVELSVKGMLPKVGP
ncbi:hypothetical protein UFOVP1623_49 [uncultured Caudovirales phage]|uniref:Uncharacterized protein n=1 Tax=uncultured Caudovirales phage TaxID=2100421 RepID=A0A6J5RZ23_9CAUD|nr:hypothetical protein UFOVP1376_14 [uncultured Caudovirales phage]CAB4220848.1 hypothetical protein UFOVP1623_49 [uncultured Caudovirales phage]